MNFILLVTVVLIIFKTGTPTAFIDLTYFVSAIEKIQQNISYTFHANDVNLYLNSREVYNLPLTNQLYKNISNEKPIKFFVHGWTENRGFDYLQTLTDVLIEAEDCYVIIVDWQLPASKDYVTSTALTRDVGMVLGDHLATLHFDLLINPSSFHLIGFSLGAHVVGFAAKRFQQITGSRIAKVTGLDPAGPLFETFIRAPPEDRLNSTDAEVVEIVHTDGGVFGFAASIGTVDFFVNGGIPPQPGCTKEITQLKVAVSCSHQRAHEYYIYGIKVRGVPAYKCSSWSAFLSGRCNNNKKIMFGTEIPSGTKGNYYFKLDL